MKCRLNQTEMSSLLDMIYESRLCLEIVVNNWYPHDLIIFVGKKILLNEIFVEFCEKK